MGERGERKRQEEGEGDEGNTVTISSSWAATIAPEDEVMIAVHDLLGREVDRGSSFSFQNVC